MDQAVKIIKNLSPGIHQGEIIASSMQFRSYINSFFRRSTDYLITTGRNNKKGVKLPGKLISEKLTPSGAPAALASTW